MKTLLRALALACVALLPLAAAAQSYPNKPVRILVPYPPGGASDVTARRPEDRARRQPFVREVSSPAAEVSAE